jgi:hypothetical protein
MQAKTGQEQRKPVSFPREDVPPIAAGSKIGRRSFLAATAAAVVTTQALGGDRDYGPGAAPVRYPDSDIVVLDKRFEKYKIGNTPIQRLHTGMLWAEGTAWSAVGRYLLWSDIPNNVQMRRLDEDGHVSVFRNPAGNSNGNTFDYEGRELSCEHGNRRVVRYEHDGKFTVLADKWDGKPFNALCFSPDTRCCMSSTPAPLTTRKPLGISVFMMWWTTPSSPRAASLCRWP